MTPPVFVEGLRAANLARQLEWDREAKITLSYRSNELAGEVGEACNVAKKLERERLGIQGSRATVEDLAAELADVVICADLVAMQEGIDLEAAVVAKFNQTSDRQRLATHLALAQRAATPIDVANRLVAVFTAIVAIVDALPDEVMAAHAGPFLALTGALEAIRPEELRRLAGAE